jgi:hypothetical protein
VIPDLRNSIWHVSEQEGCKFTLLISNMQTFTVNYVSKGLEIKPSLKHSLLQDICDEFDIFISSLSLQS